MRWPIAQPCIGSSAMTFKIKRSSVPCTRSVGLLMDSPFLSVTDKSIRALLSVIKGNVWLPSRSCLEAGVVRRGLPNGVGFAVDEVVHDHQIARRSMVAVRHVGGISTERSLSRSDLDRCDQRCRELDADEREPAVARWRMVHAQAVVVHAEQLDR